MTRDALEHRLHDLLDRYDRRVDTTDVTFGLSQPSTGWAWTYGDIGAPYFIASITKLYTAAIVMQLVRDGQVALDGSIGSYLPADVVTGLNVIDGADRSAQVTVRHLLAHTSGIADYFEQKRDDGSSTFERALESGAGWSFAEAIEIAKRRMRPKFPPGQPGKAYYSDTNYQLLGAVIESVTGDPFERALRGRIATPLDLGRTSVFTNADYDRYDTISPLLMDTRQIRIPAVMASVRADGGIVSTVEDGSRFLRAFMTAELFPAELLAEMQHEWRRIFFPLQYGTGIMRFTLPRVATGFRQVPPMIGHSGASGAVAFHVPKLDLYVVGTVNQVRKRSLAYQLLTRIVMLVARS